MNSVEENLKEFDKVFKELKKSIEDYKSSCPIFRGESKEESQCQEARKYLFGIVDSCNKLYLIFKRDEDTSNLIKENYGNGFVLNIDHFPYQHHEIGCMKGDCGATPGGVIYLENIIEEIDKGHKINNSHLPKEPEGDNIYA